MAERAKIEGEIRDWLADHLDFIAPGLSLIQKEFYLPDNAGASGFVDLLCKDSFNNFVVIEIKRSESSARQTISEILKYHSLIKHNFNARESEIRTIVISTHWNELIRPFSETVYRTSLDLTGYLIAINEKSVPVSIEKIEPLERSLISRKFAYWYGLFMFETDAQRSAFYKDFKKYLLEKGPKDFVLLNVVADLTDKRIIFPHGVIISFQKLPIDELLTAIRKLSLDEFRILDNSDDFDDEQDYRSYLEGSMINALDSLGHCSESESCYPQKVNAMFNAENWIVQSIERFGIFNTDPRYTDELLIDELTGLDGNNENAFFGLCESTQAEKLKEIREECRYSLMQSPTWLETIDVIMDKLRIEKRKFRLLVHIFNPDSLIISIYHAVVKTELNYLPTYFISIDYLDNDQSEVYYGSILWNGNAPESSFMKPFPKNEDGSRVFDLYNDPDNEKDSREMNLGYTTAKYKVVENKSEFLGFCGGQNGELVRQDSYLFPFAQFAVTYREQLEILVANHNRSYTVMKR